MKKDVKRYSILVAAWIITFFVSAVSAFSVLSAAMTNINTGVLDAAGSAKFTSSMFANAYALYQLCLAVAGIFAGRIVDKIGPKRVVLTGVLLFSAGWFFTGLCTQMWQIYLVFGILAGTGAGMIYNPNVTAALKWFPDKRGLISGILLASAALGPFTFSPVATWIIGHFQNAQITFRIFGAVFVIVMGLSAFFLKKAEPKDLPAGYTPPQADTSVPAAPLSADYHWTSMLRSPLFYLMLFLFICATTSGNMFVGANYSIAQIQTGASAGSAAMAVSICALANFFGRLLFGWLVDRLGEAKSMVLSLCVTMLSLFLMMAADTLTLYIVAVSLVGIGFGAIMVIFPPLCGKTFGMKNLGMNYGFVFIGYAGSSFVGPRIAAYFKDNIGNFQGAYQIATGITVLGGILLLVFHRLNRQAAPSVALKARADET